MIAALTVLPITAPAAAPPCTQDRADFLLVWQETLPQPQEVLDAEKELPGALEGTVSAGLTFAVLPLLTGTAPDPCDSPDVEAALPARFPQAVSPLLDLQPEHPVTAEQDWQTQLDPNHISVPTQTEAWDTEAEAPAVPLRSDLGGKEVPPSAKGAEVVAAGRIALPVAEVDAQPSASEVPPTDITEHAPPGAPPPTDTPEGHNVSASQHSKDQSRSDASDRQTAGGTAERAASAFMIPERASSDSRPAVTLAATTDPSKTAIPVAAHVQTLPTHGPLPHNSPPAPLKEALHVALRTLPPGSATPGVEIRLEPEGLGAFTLQVTETAQGLQVTVQADRADTLDLMRRHAAELVAEFRSAGMGNPVLHFGAGDSGQRSPGQTGQGAQHDTPNEQQPNAAQHPLAEVTPAWTRPQSGQSGSLILRL